MKNDTHKTEFGGRYLVVREYSHTNRRGQLLKVITRPISNLLSAEVEMDLTQQDCDKAKNGKEAFIVRIIGKEEMDREYDECKKLANEWHRGFEAGKKSVTKLM